MFTPQAIRLHAKEPKGFVRKLACVGFVHARILAYI
jgi:hypothetical protein